MFLNKLKDFWTKKTVKKRLSNLKLLNSDSSIKKVGIVFDESYFYEREELLKALIKEGIHDDKIQLLVFKNKVKKNDVFQFPVYTYNDMNWNAAINRKEFNDFINTDFDLLISYYTIEKAPLLLATQLSKANFKVGFASTDKRLHHFMIETDAENYTVFMEELLKYLKILNKL